jgi:tetratricopeptide (TPR) repeat protein
MNYFRLVSTLLFFVATTSSLLAQEQRDIFANPKNLQVLPKDITSAELDSHMRRFKLALGVECSHCHVGTDIRSFSDFDFAADTKDTKRIAREMLQMVSAINAMVSGLNRGPDHDAVEISCVTCHRGNFRPVMIKDVLVETYAEHNGDIDAVIAKYLLLREENYGGFAFDFGEFPVSAFAFTLNKQGQPEDAIKIQKMNAGFHPHSPNIPSGMGFIYRETGQFELAAEAFRQSLEVDPTGRWVARQLEEVEKLLSEKQEP